MFPGGFRNDLTEEEKEEYREFYNEEIPEMLEGSSESDGKPTHECCICGYGVREQTPYKRLELWCEDCDGIKWFCEVGNE